MIKLYRFLGGAAEYWETWEESGGVHTVHWGHLGTRGETKTVKSRFLRSALGALRKDVDRLLSEGFEPIELEDHATLLIEYAVEGMGSHADLSKRHELENRMNETLGWTGLGMCDGGSTGSGTMEVCCLVVDFNTAKSVIEADLRETDFADYVRIYRESAD